MLRVFASPLDSASNRLSWEGVGGWSLQESQLEAFSGIFSLQAVVAGAGALVHEKHRGKLSVSLGCPLPPPILFFCSIFLSSSLWFVMSQDLIWRAGEGFLGQEVRKERQVWGQDLVALTKEVLYPAFFLSRAVHQVC